MLSTNNFWYNIVLNYHEREFTSFYKEVQYILQYWI
jgi:hypothetical protein